MTLAVEHTVQDVQVPERSLVQRMEALKRANEIRTYRADMKLRVKGDPSEAADEIASPSPLVETMKVYDLLIALPKFGRVKVNTVLRRNAISPSKTVGGLSKRQRDALLLALAMRGVRPSEQDVARAA